MPGPGGRQCSKRSTITPTKTCSASLYRRIKKGWGSHLIEHTAKETWSLPESQLHINYLELKAVFLALKQFQDLCLNKTVLIATDNTTVVACINKEGDEVGHLMCPSIENPDLVYRETGNSQGSTHPRPVECDSKLSRLGQNIQTEWSLHPEVFKAICPRWTCLPPGSTTSCLSLSHRSQTPQAWAVDALSLSWEDLDPYAFPPVAILGKVVEKLQDYPESF